MRRRRNKGKRLSKIVYRFAAILCLLIAISWLPILGLRWLQPPTTAFMLQDESARESIAYEWVEWSLINSNAAYAVMAAEDQKFPDHFGFDFASIRDSLDQRDNGLELRGASTISQQVAKNLFLWPGRSFVRKGIEAYFALLLELTWPKQRILEVYLNVAEFGPGIYGVAAASQEFFATTPAGLTDAEAALLAAVLPNPARLRADRPSDYLRDRQRWILGQLQRLRREQALSF